MAEESGADPILSPDFTEETPAAPQGWDQGGFLQDAGPLLGVASLALFGVFLSSLLSALLPPRLLDPAWQARVSEGLIGSSSFAILASCLLLLAAWLDPEAGPVQRWWRRVRTLACLACLGYLLLIPLQASVLLRLGARVEQPVLRQIAQLRSSRQAIADSRDLAQLNQALRGLPGAPQLPPGFSRPLSTFRREAIAQLDGRLSQLEAARQRGNQQRRLAEVVLFFRLAGISAVLSGFYAALALPNPRQGSWLAQLLRLDLLRPRLRRRTMAGLEGEDLFEEALHGRRPWRRGGAPPASRRAPWRASDSVAPYLEEFAELGEPEPGPGDPPAPVGSPQRTGRSAAARAGGRMSWWGRGSVDPYLDELASAAELEQDPSESAAQVRREDGEGASPR